MNNISLRRINKIPWLIFIILLFFYIAITSGTFWEADSMAVYQTTKSIIDEGNFTIPCFWGREVARGECYSQYGLFISVVLIPFYLIEKFFRDVLHNTYFFPGFLSTLMNPVITALLGVLVYHFLIKLNFSKKLSVIGTFMFGLLTYLPAYTKSLYSEPLITLLIYSALYILLFKKDTARNLLLVGSLAGLTMLTKIGTVIVFPAYVYLLWWRNNHFFKKAALFAIPMLFSVGIFFLYNYFRYHNFTDTGYRDINFKTPFFYGLYIHTFSPGKSLFFYQPFIIFFIFGLKRFYKESKKAFIATSSLVIISFIFYSVFVAPTGDLAWGSRYLYYTIPFFVFCVMYFIKYNKNSLLKNLFLVSIIISAIISISAIYLSYHRYWSFLRVKLNDVNYTKISYVTPQYSPLWGQWQLIFRLGYRDKDALAWREAFQEYLTYNPNYKIAPPDIFLLRSRSGVLILIIFLLIELKLLLSLSSELSKSNK